MYLFYYSITVQALITFMNKMYLIYNLKTKSLNQHPVPNVWNKILYVGFILTSLLLFFYSPQGTIFLPGNKVTEHPTNGDEAGKFLFEVIPGRKNNLMCFYLY